MLADAIDNPASVVNLLAEALPTSAAFFLNFVVAQAFLTNALGLVNIGALAFFLVRMCIVCVAMRACWFVNEDPLPQINYMFRSAKAITRRELYNGIFADQDIVYGNELPNLILIVLIGVGKRCCAAISPWFV